MRTRHGICIASAMSTNSTKILFILGATVPTLAFAIATAMAFVTTKPEWAKTEAAEAAVARPPATYVPLDEPIDLGLYQGRIRLSVTLAFSVRLEPLQLLDLSGRVTKVRDAIRSEITAAILEIAEDETTSKDLGPRLRAALPTPLKDIVNQNLATEDLPEPVDEVLILDMSIVPG